MTDVAKCRRQEQWACRAALPFEGLEDARSGVAPAPTFGPVRLPVSDEASVGDLRLQRESLLGVVAVGVPHRIGIGAGLRARRPGGQLESAPLAPHRAGTLEGVVLATGQQMPGQDGELARDGDGRDMAPAPRGGALRERPQRARDLGGSPGRLDEHVAGRGGAFPGQPAVTRRAVARLADRGMQPEIADQVTSGRKPTGVADHRNQRRGGDHVDARDRHQPPHVLVGDDLLGDDPVDLPQLAGDEVQLAQPGVDGQALIDRQLAARRSTRGPSCRTDRRPGSDP